MNATADAFTDATAVALSPIAHPNARPKQSPEHARLYHFFNAWIKHPTEEQHYGELMDAMRDHELKDRLRKVLPWA